MGNPKCAALLPLEGSYCRAWGAGWYYLEELFCRCLGKTREFACGHKAKRITLRIIGGRTYAFVLDRRTDSKNVLCPDCEIREREDLRKRLLEAQDMSPEEKMRQDWRIAAEKATAELLKDPAIIASPEKARELKKLLGKVQKWEKAGRTEPGD